MSLRPRRSLYDRYGQPPTGAAPNFEKAPPRPDHIVIFEPPWPSDLCTEPELWIAALGPPSWGAGTVAISEDDDDYRPVGQVRRAVCGVVCGRLDAGVDGWTRLAAPLPVETFHGGQLPPFAVPALLRKESLLLLGDATAYELVTYSASDLRGHEDGNRLYSLSGLMGRGLYGTRTRAWPRGTPLLRLNAALLTVPIERRLLGWDVFIKIVSENTSGQGHDDAQTVEPIVYRLGHRGWET